MSDRPPEHAGMRHVALFVQAFEACEHFYVVTEPIDCEVLSSHNVG